MEVNLIARDTANLRQRPTHQFSQELLRSWHERGYPVSRSEVHIDYWLQLGNNQHLNYVLIYSHNSMFYYFDYRIKNQWHYLRKDFCLEPEPWQETTEDFEEDVFVRWHGTTGQ